MPEEGIEPTLSEENWILSPARPIDRTKKPIENTIEICRRHSSPTIGADGGCRVSGGSNRLD